MTGPSRRRGGPTRLAALVTLVALVTLAGLAGPLPPLTLPTASARSGAAAPARAVRCPAAPVAVPAAPQYGASISTRSATFPAALAASDARFGRLGVVRVFDPGVPPASAWAVRAPALAGRSVVTSFRMPPRAVLAGRYDAAMLRFFDSAPRTSTVYWTYWHEPEPDIAAGRFTARSYRRAWRHLARLARVACNPRLLPTLVLTGWTADHDSGRRWRHYYPGPRYVSVLAWDPYNSVHRHPRSYAGPHRLFGPALAASRAAGLPFALAETGSGLAPGDDGAGRARWLLRVARWTTRHQAVFVSYYDSVGPRGRDFRLTDPRSRAAWASVVR